jgi:hypothetical protein
MGINQNLEGIIMNVECPQIDLGIDVGTINLTHQSGYFHREVDGKTHAIHPGGKLEDCGFVMNNIELYKGEQGTLSLREDYVGDILLFGLEAHKSVSDRPLFKCTDEQYIKYGKKPLENTIALFAERLGSSTTEVLMRLQYIHAGHRNREAGRLKVHNGYLQYLEEQVKIIMPQLKTSTN